MMDTDRFLELYGTRTGPWLANRLCLHGRGRERLAASLSNYAWNTRAVRACTTESGRNVYRHAISLCREDILSHPLYPTLSPALRAMIN
jgi:hypothetical protein